MTARDAAKDLIRQYVLRGDTIEQLVAGGMGCWCPRYQAQIGGYACPDDGPPCRRIGARQIAAKVPGGKHEFFSLAELMAEIRREAAGEIIPTQAVLL